MTWKYDGSAIARTTAAGAVWTVDVPKGGVLRPPTLATDHKYIAILDALVDVVPSRLHPEREWGLVVRADVSGISAANVERKLAAGWEELATAFDPRLGVVEVECTRKDAAGADVVRHIIAENHTMPSYTPRTADPGGLDAPGAYEGAGGYIVFPIGGKTLFPYWVGSTLLSLDTAPAAAELDISGVADTVTIVNPGNRWAGLRIEVKAASVSGSVTRITVSNAANGDSVVINDAGPFAAADGLDWFASDPRKVAMLGAGTTIVSADVTSIRIEPGSNVLTGTRTLGAGTLTLSLSWPDLRLTL